MKKVVFIFFTLLLITAFIIYYQYFRGVGPAINKIPAITPIPTTNPINNQPQNSTDLPLKIPPNLSISYFAKGVDGARDLIFDSSGTLLVSEPNQGKVVAILNTNEKIAVFSGLNRPHGLAFSGNILYIAETNQVATYNYDPKTHTAKNKRKIIDLPSGGNHWTRSLLIKDDKLYIAIGSTCNVCNESDWHRAKILVSNLDGSDLKIFASGLRNSVFMTTHPQTSEIWATEMGHDFLGDDLPPDEINKIFENRNYGWPFCYGKNIHDTNFDKNIYFRNSCEQPLETESLIDLPAHSAPLGLAFIPDNWPKEYRGKLLVAFHGSWNRSVPTGYKIVIIDPNSKQIEDFISGWLINLKESLGRPVDLAFDKDGNLYVSDDKAGVIYLVRPR